MSVVEPTERLELAEALARASAERRTVRVRGGGAHGRRGHVTDPPDWTLSTLGLDRVVDHVPEDLTVTVEAGVRLSDLQATLASAGQRWPQADGAPGATVGGAVSAGASGRLRLRHGPIRDGLLEVVLVTGDGRVGRAGGRTVKGVAGYDLPRLVVGALGTLGVIAQVTLKLWPVPPASGWYRVVGDMRERVGAAERWLRELVRPAAILLRPDGAWLHREGAPGDVTAPPGALPSDEPPRLHGVGLVQAGVPAPRIVELIRALETTAMEYEAQVGVGACMVAVGSAEDVGRVRALAAALGGHAWVADGPDEIRVDPWGAPPDGLAVMRRLKAALDPARVLSPGIMVGGI